MKRDEVLKILRAHKGILAERFGVAELAIFGSFARDEAGEDSDVDILVHFDGPAHWRRFFDAQFLHRGSAWPRGRSGDGEDGARRDTPLC